MISTEMTITEAKEIWGRVTSDWQKLPRGKRGIGSKRQIGQRLWLQTNQAIPFEEWFRDVVRKATHTPSVVRKATYAEQLQMNGENGKPVEKKLTISERYKALAMNHDLLPSDDMLGDLWNCAGVGTLGPLRSRLREHGFLFEKMQGGQWRVVERPTLKPKEVQHTLPIPAPSSGPLKVTSATVNGVQHIDSQPHEEQLIDAIRVGFARQNVLITETAGLIEARIGELTQIMTEVAQIMRETWK